MIWRLNPPEVKPAHHGVQAVNHVIHMMAVARIRHCNSPDCAYLDHNIAERNTGKEAIRDASDSAGWAEPARLETA